MQAERKALEVQTTVAGLVGLFWSHSLEPVREYYVITWTLQIPNLCLYSRKLLLPPSEIVVYILQVKKRIDNKDFHHKLGIEQILREGIDVDKLNEDIEVNKPKHKEIF